MATTWRGVRSSSVAGTFGSSSRIAPAGSAPRHHRAASSIATSASAIACEPPRAIGHPTRCPRTAIMRPYPAVGVRRSESMECAAIPVKSPRASSVSNRRLARCSAEKIPASPKRAMGIGARGKCNGSSNPSTRSCRTSGPIRRWYAFPSTPSPAAVVSTDRCSTAARPPSSGCASGNSGWIHSRP